MASARQGGQPCLRHQALVREGNPLPFFSAFPAPRHLHSAGENNTRAPSRGSVHVTRPVAGRHGQGTQRLLRFPAPAPTKQGGRQKRSCHHLPRSNLPLAPPPAAARAGSSSRPPALAASERLGGSGTRWQSGRRSRCGQENLRPTAGRTGPAAGSQGPNSCGSEVNPGSP